MAVSRGTVVFFCLGSLCVLFAFFFASGEAAIGFESSELSHIHAVNHKLACKGKLDSDKGNQCQNNNDDGDDDDDDELDDDIDDTYKVVDNVKVTLSHGGHDKSKPQESSDDDTDDSPETDPDQFDVLGH